MPPFSAWNLAVFSCLLTDLSVYLNRLCFYENYDLLFERLSVNRGSLFFVPKKLYFAGKTMGKEFIAVKDLQRNDGQLEYLPSNPRKLTDAKKWLLTESILKFPQMISLRKIVLDSVEAPVSIGGNMRLLVILEEKYKKTV